MISENLSLPKSIKEAEDRFIVKLKENLLRMIKEINRLEKKVSEFKEFEGISDISDVLDLLKRKANVDASNVGNNIDGDNRDKTNNKEEWGDALYFEDLLAEPDNTMLISSGNLHNEGHVPFETDVNDQPANPYFCLNQAEKTREVEVEDPTSQTGYSTVTETYTDYLYDSTIAENLIALDTKLKEVNDSIPVVTPPDLSGKANVALDNITEAGKLLINNIGMESVEVVAGNNVTISSRYKLVTTDTTQD